MPYRWECPICGRSQTNESGGTDGKENAIAALRAHIVASDGAGHGPRHSLPDGDTSDLSQHVVRQDRSGRASESGWG